MLKRTRKNFQQLVIQNKLEIQSNREEMEKIEKKLEEKQAKANSTTGSY